MPDCNAQFLSVNIKSGQYRVPAFRVMIGQFKFRRASLLQGMTLLAKKIGQFLFRTNKVSEIELSKIFMCIQRTV